MTNLSAKSMSDIGSLIKTAEVQAYEASYQGPSLEERLVGVAADAPLHKLINAILLDLKARTTNELFELLRDRGFTLHDVRVCMQNVYRRKLVVSIPLVGSRSTQIAYRINSHDAWPDDIVSPVPVPGTTKAVTKATLADLPPFPVNLDPQRDLIPDERIERAIWKLFQDGERRRMPEIVKALQPYLYDAQRVKQAMRRLSKLHWFIYTTGHETVVYLIKKGVPMPEATGPIEPFREQPTAQTQPVEPEPPAPTYLDLQRDGIFLTIWKIMRDGEVRSNRDIAQIIESMCDSTRYLQYTLASLSKKVWFHRKQEGGGNGAPQFMTYRLRADVAEPPAQPITARRDPYWKTDPSKPEVPEQKGIVAAGWGSQLPPAAGFPGDLAVARQLGMPQLNLVATEDSLSATLRAHVPRHRTKADSFCEQVTAAAARRDASYKNHGMAATSKSVDPLAGLAAYLLARDQHLPESMESLRPHPSVPLVRVSVEIAGVSITPEQADEIVDELSDLGFGDSKEVFESDLIKVKMEIAGIEFSLETVDEIVSYLRREGFGKQRKQS